MKTIISHLFLLLPLFCLIYSCNSPSPPKKEQNTTPTENEQQSPQNPIQKATTVGGKIKVIRSLYKETQDNLTQFKTEKKAYSSELETVVIGELEVYKKGGKVVKLIDSVEEDHGPGTNEFYFLDKELFFLLSQVTTVEMTEKPNQHVRELRLYFDGNEIIDALVKTKIFQHGETIDMSIVANERESSLIGSEEEAEYYLQLANETLEFFESKESFDEFYGEE